MYIYIHIDTYIYIYIIYHINLYHISGGQDKTQCLIPVSGWHVFSTAETPSATSRLGYWKTLSRAVKAVLVGKNHADILQIRQIDANWLYVHIYIYTVSLSILCIYIYTYTCKYIHIYIYINKYVYMYMFIYLNKYLYTYMYIYIYICK